MRKIAKKIGVNVSTVSREINRCKDKIYTLEEKQENYLKQSKLKERWSPE